MRLLHPLRSRENHDRPFAGRTRSTVAETDLIFTKPPLCKANFVEWSVGQPPHDRIAACDANRNFQRNPKSTLDRNPLIAAKGNQGRLSLRERVFCAGCFELVSPQIGGGLFVSSSFTWPESPTLPKDPQGSAAWVGGVLFRGAKGNQGRLSLRERVFCAGCFELVSLQIGGRLFVSSSFTWPESPALPKDPQGSTAWVGGVLFRGAKGNQGRLSLRERVFCAGCFELVSPQIGGGLFVSSSFTWPESPTLPKSPQGSTAWVGGALSRSERQPWSIPTIRIVWQGAPLRFLLATIPGLGSE